MPLLTVIVPTLNRSRTLLDTLTTLRSQDYGDVEYLISDNCSDDNTTRIVSDFSVEDDRFVLIRPPQRLPMSQHWEFALQHAGGNYVSFLGDDDGLTPSSLSVTSKLLQEFEYPEALNSFNLDYHWPDSPVPFAQNLSRMPLGNTSWIRESCEVFDALRGGSVEYDLCPMIYRGWVRSNVISDLRNKTKHVFRASSPDVYAAVALCALTRRFALTEIPLFIMGVSGHSTGGKSFHGATADDAEFWVADSIPFHPEIPLGASNAILVQEVLLQCRDAGLITDTMLMDWSTVVSKAAHECIYLSAERFHTCLDGLRKIAAHHGVAFDVNRVLTQFDDHSKAGSPFPDKLAWFEKWKYHVDGVAFRTDAWGIKSLSDFYRFLDTNASPSSIIPRSVVAVATLYQSLDKAVSQTQATLISLHAQGAEKDDEIHRLSQKLTRMERSPFWRLTWPLRFLTRRILGVYRKFRQKTAGRIIAGS